MRTVTIHDAKTNLSKYIARAKQGEHIYIGGFGKAEVQLVKIASRKNSSTSTRDFSVAKGKISAAPDAFSTSTDAAIARKLLAD